MIKRLTVAVAALFALAGIAQAAGTVPGFSLTPQFDLTGKIAPGCRLFVIQAGTVSTPQNVYQDSGLSILAPNPLTCDASSRLPQFFVADGTIKLRLTTSIGTQIFVGDNLLVVGPSSGGGGGGGTVDPTTILSTGDIKVAYGTGILSGFVRANGRTIGSATSGATERANSDTNALFLYLWGADANLAVSGGRGASAAADWSANKTIALPDARGRTIAGLDDMGNSAAGRLTATYFGATGTCSGVLGTTLGAACGGESQLLTTAQVPVIAPAGTIASTITFNAPGNAIIWESGAGTQSGSAGVSDSRGVLTGNITSTFTGTPFGGGAAHPNVPPTILSTIYIKL